MANILQIWDLLDRRVRFPAFLGLSQLSTISALEKLGNIVSKIRRADNARRQYKVASESKGVFFQQERLHTIHRSINSTCMLYDKKGAKWIGLGGTGMVRGDYTVCLYLIF